MLIKESSAKPQRRLAADIIPNSDPVGLDWLLRTLWRRKIPIILTTILLSTLAALLVARVPAVYVGQAEVLIDPRNVGSGDLQSGRSGVADAEMLQSQVRVLQSRNLAYKIVEALELDGDPEFNVTLRHPGTVDRLLGWGRTKLGQWGVLPAEAPAADNAAVRPETEMAGVVDRFLDALEVELLSDLRAIAIKFASHSPERAAQGANKTAEIYILDQLDAKYEATQRATQWLTDKIAELRRNVASAEQAVQKFRSQSGLLQGPGGTMVTQQISDLNAQLIVVRTARAEAEQRLARVRQAAQSVGGGDAVRSATTQALIDQEIAIKRRISDLAKEFGDRHPQMVAARADLADVQDKLQRETQKAQSALETEVNAARSREAAINRSIDQLRGKVGQSASAENQLRSLEREAEASRSMLETFLARFEQATAQLDASINETDARIISRADVPTSASSPPVKLIVGLTFVISALLATLLALLLEGLDRGYRSGEQIEKATGLRALGLVPAVGGAARGNPAAYLLRHPSSMFGESIRSLYTGILLSPDLAPPRKLLVTSSQPKEGKTTISVCLGRMRALAGHKTVIIEADLRRPSVHRVLDIPRRPGLTEVVLGEAKLDDVLVEDKESGAFVLPAGKLAPDPTEILSAPMMSDILQTLADRFELVVIDSPPLVAVADSRLLAPQVDAAILVVRWAVTPRQVVALAAKQLAEAGANITGAVLSLVDSKKHARYGFADSAYYYGPVKRYYSS
ncbi:MAG: polysaccharide biosynthesis tyrosine autokinase [Rhodospirillales bacterium]|nr:polysaccharide biosynthesis tyrosine autokinase [Rhodospirillales bacterium]